MFFNQPIAFLGSPRTIWGMVGIAHSNGKNERANSYVNECIKIFESHGQEPIDYYNNHMKETTNE